MSTVWHHTVLGLLTLIILPCVYSNDNDPDCINGDGKQFPQFADTPSSILAHLGETVEFNCSGYYRALPADAYSPRSVEWIIVSVMQNCNIDCRLKTIPGFTEDYPRYKTSSTTSQNGRVIRKTLTITNVSAQDYDKFLQCRLTSAEKHQPCATVRIQPYAPNKEIDIGMVLLGVVAVIIVFGSLLAYCCWGPRISLWCYSTFGHMCRRYNPERYACDVLVLHDEDDHSFVSYMAKKLKELENLRFKTMAAHLSPDQPLFGGTQELIMESYCVMFIITPDILNEALYSHLLNVARQLKRKILLVEVHTDGHKLTAWKTYTNKYRRSESLENGLKYMKTLRWPGDKASTRQKNSFFCKIRRQLPVNTNSIMSTAEQTNINCRLI